MWAYPIGTDVPYRLKNSINKDNINNLSLCVWSTVRETLPYLHIFLLSLFHPLKFLRDKDNNYSKDRNWSELTDIDSIVA